MRLFRKLVYPLRGRPFFILIKEDLEETKETIKYEFICLLALQSFIYLL